MNRIYLDHNATTPMHPDVLKAMLPYFKGDFGNASSIHSFGQEANRAMEKAREQVALLVGAEPREVIFTSGGTEADNFAIRGVLEAVPKKRHVVTSPIEHHAVIYTLKALEKKGLQLTTVGVDSNGRVDPAEVASAVRSDTALVSIMFANNEMGTVQPIAEIGELLSDVVFHTDGVQALGKIPIRFSEAKLDLLSLSSHKIHGPKGVGALVVARGTRIRPIITGGHHERNMRAGTENVPGIVGFGAACEIARQEFDQVNPRLAALRDRLQEGLFARLEDLRLNGHPLERLPNTLNISFAYVEGESLLLNLDLKGIALSTGSACTSGDLKPSHVLTSMGLTPEVAHGSLRFTLGRDNTEEEMDRTVEAVVEVVNRVRAMSPLYPKKGADA
jgi:cysteine desulfurase